MIERVFRLSETRFWSPFDYEAVYEDWEVLVTKFGAVDALDITNEQEQDLHNMIAATVDQWQEKHGIKPYYVEKK